MLDVHCARPPHDCKRIPRRPFAALDHDLAADPRLSPTDKTLLLAMLFYARSKAECWPSDRSLGARIGRSPATVQRRLRHLERLGLVGRRPGDNPTGRVLVLAWRSRTDEGTPRSPVTDPPMAPMRDEGDVIVGEASNEKGRGAAPRRQRPEPAAQADDPAEAPTDASPGVPDPAEAPTPGQLAFLATLTPPEREKFDRSPAEDRRKLLNPHRAGLDRIVLAEDRKRLATPRPDPRSAPLPRDATVEEMVRSLPGTIDRSRVFRTARALAVAVREPEKSATYRAMERWCNDIMAGVCGPDSLLIPLARAFEAAGRGEVERLGPYLSRSIANYRRENGRA